MPDDLVVPLIVKLGGSIGGAILSLVFTPPKNIAEFVTRSVFSIIGGFIFGDPVRENYLHWPQDDWRMWLASAALVSMLSWVAMGAVTRIIGKLKWTPGAPKE